MPKHISLSDVACSSRSVSDFRFAIGFRLVVVRVVRFDPRCGPARPGPARAPLPTPCARPPPPDPFVSFDVSRAVTSLSLFHNLSLSPRGALGFGDGDHRSWIPEVSSPPFSSLSLFLSLPFFSPARAPPAALARGPLRPQRGGLRPRRRGPPLLPPRGGAACPCSLPRGGTAPPAPAPSPAAARPRPPLLPPPRRRGPPLLPPRRPRPRRRPPVRGPGPRRAAPCARPRLPVARRGPSRPPAPLRAASRPRRRGSLAPSRAAPRPPARGRPAPGARPLPSAAWTPARLAWPRRGLALPRLPQCVPACAAPRAR
jgi:hypothetical protein